MKIEPQIIETPYGKRRFYDVEQNTAPWYELRSGIPTASGAEKIVTPAKLELSKQSEAYLNKLIAEREAGHVLEFQSDAMKEGHDREPESRAAFTLATKIQVKPGGFWTTEDGRFGASPDGLIERTLPDGTVQRGILELKNPNASTHVGYRRDPALLEADYRIQLLSGFYAVGVDFIWIQSYYPELKSVRRLVERSEETVKTLANGVTAFCDRLDAEWKKLNA